MYFSLLPNLKYDKKPVQYPFSESDYVTVKNFFKRFQINPDVFSYTVFFQKYSISDGERIEALAERAYGNPLYDWVIILTNNLINPSFEWPLSSNDLRKHVEKNYDDPYTTIRHYEIVDEETQIENYGRVLYPPGTRVDQAFHNSSIKINDNGVIEQVSGSLLSTSVSIYEYEYNENEKKREIYLLKPRYLQDFMDDLKKQSKYKRSSSFVSAKLKETNK